jgi:putative sterol carrier protein
MDVSTVEKYMQAMAQGFRSDKAGGLRITYQLQLTGEGGGTWTVSIADGRCRVSQGASPGADISITMSTDHYLRLATGRLNAIDAYNKGQIKVSGDTEYALKFIELFPPWASRVPLDAPPAPSPTPPQPEPSPAEPTLADYVRAMPRGFRSDKAGDLRVTYQFQLTGAGGGTWTVTVANQACTVAEGQTASPSAVIRMSGTDFIKLAQGKLNTTHAYSQGEIKISGDLDLAARIPDIFEPWAEAFETAPPPTPAPTPTPEPTPSPEPSPQPSPSGPVNPTLLNGSFDDYQPYIRGGEAQFWIEPQFPERYGAHWTLVVISETQRRCHLMDSETFGKFTQKYFGGGGRDYHIHGRHSQVVTSRSGFDLVLMQTVAAQPGREYAFRGSIVSFYKGTSGPPVHDKVFKTLGIDPTGGRDYRNSTVVWGERDGRDNEWRYPVVRVKAQADAITVFIRLENIEADVGITELNIIHLDDFKLES